MKTAPKTRRRNSRTGPGPLPLPHSEPAAGPRLVAPFSIRFDTREQRPFTFESIPADAAERERTGCELITVPVLIGTLASGDYSLAGYENRVAVERKSLADLFGTVGQGRDRFQRELARLQTYDFAAVVVEAEWSEVFASPPRHSSLSPKTIFRSVLAWQQRFPRVHWHFWPGRESAEVVTFRILERYWKERQNEAKEAVKGGGGELQTNTAYEV